MAIYVESWGLLRHQEATGGLVQDAEKQVGGR